MRLQDDFNEIDRLAEQFRKDFEDRLAHEGVNEDIIRLFELERKYGEVNHCMHLAKLFPSLIKISPNFNGIGVDVSSAASQGLEWFDETQKERHRSELNRLRNKVSSGAMRCIDYVTPHNLQVANMGRNKAFALAAFTRSVEGYYFSDRYKERLANFREQAKSRVDSFLHNDVVTVRETTETLSQLMNDHLLLTLNQHDDLRTHIIRGIHLIERVKSHVQEQTIQLDLIDQSLKDQKQELLDKLEALGFDLSDQLKYLIYKSNDISEQLNIDITQQLNTIVDYVERQVQSETLQAKLMNRERIAQAFGFVSGIGQQFNNPSMQRVGLLGEASLQVFSAAEQFRTLSSANNLLSISTLNPAIAVLGVGMTIFSAFSKKKTQQDGLGSAITAIFEMLKQISRQIEEMHRDMQQSFSAVFLQFSNLFEYLDSQFNSLRLSLTVPMHIELSRLNDMMTGMQLELRQEFFDRSILTAQESVRNTNEYVQGRARISELSGSGFTQLCSKLSSSACDVSSSESNTGGRIFSNTLSMHSRLNVTVKWMNHVIANPSETSLIPSLVSSLLQHHALIAPRQWALINPSIWSAASEAYCKFRSLAFNGTQATYNYDLEGAGIQEIKSKTNDHQQFIRCLQTDEHLYENLFNLIRQKWEHINQRVAQIKEETQQIFHARFPRLQNVSLDQSLETIISNYSGRIPSRDIPLSVPASYDFRDDSGRSGFIRLNKNEIIQALKDRHSHMFNGLVSLAHDMNLGELRMTHHLAISSGHCSCYVRSTPHNPNNGVDMNFHFASDNCVVMLLQSTCLQTVPSNATPGFGRNPGEWHHEIHWNIHAHRADNVKGLQRQVIAHNNITKTVPLSDQFKQKLSNGIHSIFSEARKNFKETVIAELINSKEINELQSLLIVIMMIAGFPESKINEFKNEFFIADFLSEFNSYNENDHQLPRINAPSMDNMTRFFESLREVLRHSQQDYSYRRDYFRSPHLALIHQGLFDLNQLSAHVTQSQYIEQDDSDDESDELRQHNNASIYAAVIPRRRWVLTKDANGQPKRLGNGAYGEVLAAKYYDHQNNMQLVAIKRLNGRDIDENPELKNVMFTEIKNLNAMRGANNIVAFFGVTRSGKPGNIHYNIIMELADSGTLGAYLDEHHKDPNRNVSKAPIPQQQQIKLALDIARGLNALHGHNPPIIHRDIKDTNILLFTREQGVLEAKIADLGIAKFKSRVTASQTVTQATSRRGTLLWQAPEAVTKNIYETFGDIFSFGLIMWRLIEHGRTFFDSTDENLLPDNASEISNQYTLIMQDNVRLAFLLGHTSSNDKDTELCNIATSCWANMFQLVRSPNGRTLVCNAIPGSNRITAEEAVQRLERLLV